MRLDLKEYQSKAVVALLRSLANARNEVRSGGAQQAIVFSAPTAAGKTVMLASLIEELLFGGECSALAHFEPDPETSFLWLSDRPDLNEQSRRKLLGASEALSSDRLVVIENNFDAPRFEPGTVYFLNYQKLRNDALLNRLGNSRTHTIWETIAATQAARPGRLVVIIDEAHRGLNRSSQEDREARTIAASFIEGGGERFTIRTSDGRGVTQFPACDIVVGVSATPTRFDVLLGQNHDRVRRSVPVTPGAVRGQGLIKDKVELFGLEDANHPWTLLEAAANRFREMEASWQTYCENNPPLPVVRPALLIQVQDGQGDEVSTTPLAQVIETLRRTIPDLSEEQIAHCFSGVGDRLFDGRWTTRSVNPNEIEGDTNIRVVLFKTALNTGWDCPRAEVMMSFRRVEDGTNIAQLVGRMLRTPLARSIPGDESLNSTYLYLPHYDRAELIRIRDYLMSPDVEAGVDVDFGDDFVDLSLRPDGERLFNALRLLPTQVVSSGNAVPAQKRVFRLARLLAQDGIAVEAPGEVRAALLQILTARMDATYAAAPELRGQLAERQAVPLVSLVVQPDGLIAEGNAVAVAEVSDVDLENSFRAASFIVAPEIGEEWNRLRFDEELPLLAKSEFLVLASNATLRAEVGRRAEEIINNLFHRHRAEILGQPEARLALYTDIQRTGRGVQEAWLTPEARIRVRVEADAVQCTDHLFVVPGTADACEFHFNNWENAVLAAARAEPSYLGFLRNMPRKRWALSIAYRMLGSWQAMFPDFLVFRDDGSGRVLVDILEPHQGEDSVAKLKGMALFAERHGAAFGRIEMIRFLDGQLRRLAVHDAGVRERVSQIQSHEDLLTAFADT